MSADPVLTRELQCLKDELSLAHLEPGDQAPSMEGPADHGPVLLQPDSTAGRLHRRHVATHSNADAARQAGAVEHQVVLGRLARRPTHRDVLGSLVVLQRNPLDGNVERLPTSVNHFIRSVIVKPRRDCQAKPRALLPPLRGRDGAVPLSRG